MSSGVHPVLLPATATGTAGGAVASSQTSSECMNSRGTVLKGGVPPTAWLPGTLVGHSVSLQSPGKGFHPKPNHCPILNCCQVFPAPCTPPRPCASLLQVCTPWSWTSYRNESGQSSPPSLGARRSPAMEPRPLNAAGAAAPARRRGAPHGTGWAGTRSGEGGAGAQPQAGQEWSTPSPWLGSFPFSALGKR